MTGLAPLTPEKRQVEMKIRRTMLKLHQAGGFITLAGMIAQGFVEGTCTQIQQVTFGWHTSLATFVNISYATTALLTFTAPPPLVNRKGVSSVKIHKALAMVHLLGMIATNVLADQVEDNPNLKPYHRAAAYTTFGAFAAAAIVIKFLFKKMIRITNTFLLLLILFSTSYLLHPPTENGRITADKAASQISYTMVHPLHEWTGISRAVNCIIIYNPAERQDRTAAGSIPLSSFDSKNANRDSHDWKYWKLSNTLL